MNCNGQIYRLEGINPPSTNSIQLGWYSLTKPSIYDPDSRLWQSKECFLTHSTHSIKHNMKLSRFFKDHPLRKQSSTFSGLCRILDFRISHNAPRVGVVLVWKPRERGCISSIQLTAELCTSSCWQQRLVRLHGWYQGAGFQFL